MAGTRTISSGKEAGNTAAEQGKRWQQVEAPTVPQPIHVETLSQDPWR
jgi:hypothetical protein